MKLNVLVTGGAGFIGSHLVDELLSVGCKVRVLDNLSPQVHGEHRGRPDYLSRDAELIIGDVRSMAAVRKSLQGIDAVFHFAALVGVGESMYRIQDYVEVNDLGTANILQALSENPVKKLVIASSMSVYGEGLCMNEEGNEVHPENRNLPQLKQNQWELRDASGRCLIPVKTPESKRPNVASVYALSKYVQERMCLLVGKAYGIATVALRFFNVYGPRQALSNPYTGVLAIFASRLLNNERPVIFEDGLQQRDFVHVRDIARACRLAISSDVADGHVFNIGSGQSYTICGIATKLAETLGKGHLSPEISGRFRFGDIRHCFADISLAKDLLKFEPKTRFEDGLAELGQWLDGKEASDHWKEASLELQTRGLTG